MRLRISGKTINEMGVAAALAMFTLLFMGWQWSTTPGPIDGDAFTAGSNEFAPVGGVHDTTSPSALGEGKIGFWRLSTNRHGLMLIGDGQYNERWARVDSSGNLQSIDANSVNMTNWLRLIEGYLAAGPTNQVNVLLTNSLSATVSTAGVTNVTGSPFYAQVTNTVTVTGSFNASNSTNVGVVASVSLPVTGAVSQAGTWTVDLGATDNGVLDNIDADATTIISNVDGLEALGIAQTNLLTGTSNVVVTIKTDTASIVANTGDLDANTDGIEGLLTTIDADTSTLAATDFMLGTDFSAVYGTTSIMTTTQADDLANTLDGAQSTSFAYVFDGTTWDRLRGDSTNGVLVNLGANNDVTVTGTVDLGATDNGVLDNIDADATTIIGHVDGLEALGISQTNLLTGATNVLVTIDADTSNISSDTDTLVTQTADLDANTDGIEGQLTSIQAALDFQTNGVLMASGVTANGAVYSNLVKASAAKVYSINVGNTNGNQVLYGKVFNQASAVAVGGITPVYTFIVPGATNGAGNNVVFPNGGLALSSGFYLAITAGPATNDATAVTGVQVWGATYR